jgi:hypothetical protein
MFKWSWPGAPLLLWLLWVLAAPSPVRASETPYDELSPKKVSRSVPAPQIPGDRDPLAGDDDMPDRNTRPHVPGPIAQAAPAPGSDRTGWLWSLWERLQARWSPRFEIRP